MLRPPLIPLLLRALAFAAVLLVAPLAAADELAECISAHEGAQRLRRDGRLLAARDELDACTREGCPEPVREDCVRWLDELSSAQPTVVVIARDAKTGAELFDVKVRVDGALVAERLTGRAFPVDPGERHVRLEAADGRVMETKLLIAEGDKGRRVTITFPAPPKPPRPPPKTKRGPHPAVYVLGGLGAAGIIVFAVLGGVGLSMENDLADTCAPNCSEDEINNVRRLYVAGDVLGAFGVVCGLAALTVGLIDGFSDKPATAELLLTPGGATLVTRW